MNAIKVIIIQTCKSCPYYVRDIFDIEYCKKQGKPINPPNDYENNEFIEDNCPLSDYPM